MELDSYGEREQSDSFDSVLRMSLVGHSDVYPLGRALNVRKDESFSRLKRVLGKVVTTVGTELEDKSSGVELVDLSMKR